MTMPLTFRLIFQHLPITFEHKTTKPPYLEKCIFVAQTNCTGLKSALLQTFIQPIMVGFQIGMMLKTRPTWYHNMSSVTQAGPCIRSNQLDFDDEVVLHAQRYLYDYVRREQDRPFCLTVSMTHPHDPYAIPPEYWDRYEDDEIDLPKITIKKEDQDPHSARLQNVYDYYAQDLSEQQIRNARHAYYGAISYVDDKIGMLLKTLKETGLDDNTIIVFSGDHGDMLGERNLWYKMSFFEGSARVPMIVHAPNRFTAKRVKESVSTIDLLPTFLEMATGTSNHKYAMPIQGRSLMPHIQGKSGAHDEVIG